MTALSLVKEAYEVKKGDTILVHAAAGGVGLLMGQILKGLGATAIGTASTKEKCDRAKEHGYAHMINYKDIPDWVAEVKKIAPGGCQLRLRFCWQDYLGGFPRRCQAERIRYLLWKCFRASAADEHRSIGQEEHKDHESNTDAVCCDER